MKRLSKSWIFAVAALVFGCSGDINRSSSPVELVVTNTQNLNQIDLLDNLIASEDERAKVARIVEDRRNLRDRSLPT